MFQRWKQPEFGKPLSIERLLPLFIVLISHKTLLPNVLQLKHPFSCLHGYTLSRNTFISTCSLAEQFLSLMKQTPFPLHVLCFLKLAIDYSRIITNHHKCMNHEYCIDGDSRVICKLRIWQIWFAPIRHLASIYTNCQRARIRFILVCDISIHYLQSRMCDSRIFI